MNVIQRIIKNSSILTISAGIRGLFGFLCIMYSARYLGVIRFGILSFAIAFAEIFTILADLGLSTYLTREVVKNYSTAKKFLSNIVALKLCSLVLSFLILIVFIQTTSLFQGTAKIILIVLAAHIFINLRRMFNGVFRAHEKMEYIASGDIFNSILLLSGVFFAISRKFDVLGFSLIYLLTTILPFTYAFLICNQKFVKFTINFDWSFWKKCLQEAWPLGGMALCIIIYFRIDAVMLSFMKGDVEVGIYSAAYRLSEATTIIPLLLVSSIFPVLSKYHERSIDQFNRVYRTAVKYLSTLAFPMVLTAYLLSDWIIGAIYKTEFSQSVETFQILTWASAIMYITMVLGNVFVTANRQRANFKLAIIAVFLNIGLNLLLIPQHSYLGASYATVITEFFGLIVGLYFLNKWGYVINLKTVFFPQAIGFVIAGILAYSLIRLNINLFLILLASNALYFIVSYKLGFEESDRIVIKSIFSASEN